MSRKKRKLTAAEKREKRRRPKEFMTIFVNGKQKRVKRPPTIDGMPVDEFIRRNADPIWLLQHEMWEELHEWTLENLYPPYGVPKPPVPLESTCSDPWLDVPPGESERTFEEPEPDSLEHRDGFEDKDIPY